MKEELTPAELEKYHKAETLADELRRTLYDLSNALAKVQYTKKDSEFKVNLDTLFDSIQDEVLELRKLLLGVV